ncbi:MAG: hypothetical protein PHX83_17155 [Acidobacteriia bacterium]|nr:hypothetical protein [Terriglobia bacterium]
MPFWTSVLTASGHQCSNCNALIHESTFQEKKGLCGLCASNETVAAKRRTTKYEDAVCAGCGITEQDRFRQLEKSEKEGAFIYMKDWPVVLYCDHCHKYFCGACQIDLGMNAGCPICRKDLES